MGDSMAPIDPQISLTPQSPYGHENFSNRDQSAMAVREFALRMEYLAHRVRSDHSARTEDSPPPEALSESASPTWTARNHVSVPSHNSEEPR